MAKHKVPKECKNCIRLWTKGVKDGKHNMWCTAYQGMPAWAQVGHCKNTGFSMRNIV